MSAERGFTLVEMLVALAIFGLAALALLRLEGAVLGNAGRLTDATLGQIVARNLTVEALTADTPPALGRGEGKVTNAGRTWRWTRTVTTTGQSGLIRVEIAVATAEGSPAARLTSFRRTS